MRLGRSTTTDDRHVAREAAQTARRIVSQLAQSALPPIEHRAVVGWVAEDVWDVQLVPSPTQRLVPTLLEVVTKDPRHVRENLAPLLASLPPQHRASLFLDVQAEARADPERRGVMELLHWTFYVAHESVDRERAARSEGAEAAASMMQQQFRTYFESNPESSRVLELRPLTGDPIRVSASSFSDDADA